VFGHLKMPLRVPPPTSAELGANGFEAAALAEPVPGRQVHALAEAAGCVRVAAGQPAAELAGRERSACTPPAHNE
jgi:hypothetical protein